MSAPDYAQYNPKILLALTEASTDVKRPNLVFSLGVRGDRDEAFC
jgi:hypothetical protein